MDANTNLLMHYMY